MIIKEINTTVGTVKVVDTVSGREPPVGRSPGWVASGLDLMGGIGAGIESFRAQ